MNRNKIIDDTWSNMSSACLFRDAWPKDPVCKALFDEGKRCGKCSRFALLNEKWGICFHQDSRYRLETLSVDFTCREIEIEEERID